MADIQVVTIGVQGPAGVSGSSVPATTTTLGGVIVGTNLNVLANGLLSANAAVTTNLPWANITGKPTFANIATSGLYTDLTDTPNLSLYLTTANAATTYSVLGHTHAISGVIGLQSALDAKQVSGSYVLTGDSRLTDARTPLAHTQAWSTITGTPTLLGVGGYGITDGLTAATAASTYLPSANFSFANIAGKPSTLGGYGINDGLLATTAASTYLSISTAASTYATVSSLSAYAPLASPTLTGTPQAPTATAGTSTTQLATTAFVAGAVSTLDGGTATNGVVATPLYPLDAGGSPVAAFGTKKLSSTYTGSAMRLVRSSDSAELDIGFVGQELDSSAVSTFLGTGTGLVSVLYDQTGNGRHLTQTTTANMPVLIATNLAGKYPVVPMSVGFFGMPSTITLSPRSFQVATVLAFTANNLAGVYEIAASSGAGIRLFSQGPWLQSSPGGTSTYASQVGLKLLIHSGSSTSSLLNYDGEVVTGAAAADSSQTGGFVGKIYIGGYVGNFQLASLILYPSTPSPTINSGIATAFKSIYNATTGPGVVVFQGDSIMASSVSTTYSTHFGRTALQSLAGRQKSYTFASGGRTIAAILAGGLTDEASVFSRYSTERRVALLFVGTNDLTLSGRTATQIYDDIKTYALSVRGMGSKVVVSSILPNSAWNTTQQTTRTTLNALIRANWPTFADGFCDFELGSVMGPQSAAGNTTLYLDGLHPTPYGNSLLAALAATKLSQVLA